MAPRSAGSPRGPGGCSVRMPRGATRHPPGCCAASALSVAAGACLPCPTDRTCPSPATCRGVGCELPGPPEVDEAELPPLTDPLLFNYTADFLTVEGLTVRCVAAGCAA